MTNTNPSRRRPLQAEDASLTTAGRREAHVLARSMRDAPVRGLLVAGGLRGFRPEDLIEGAA
ncbi:hypothetical protein AB0300_15570 [Microbacterium sp. NPDC078814]|uniref:hypothetical protein n=1 Tax=Microbacterium sp. NPDC078814 TaxID=3154767 RepID=UPI00344CDE7C